VGSGTQVSGFPTNQDLAPEIGVHHVILRVQLHDSGNSLRRDGVRIDRLIMRLTLRIFLFVALAVIVGLRVSTRLNGKSSGLFVQTVGHSPRSDCGDSSVIVLQISKEHSFRINSETVSDENLKRRLSEIYRPRLERVLLVSANPDVSFQDVVRAIDIAQQDVPHLYVALINRGEEKKSSCLFIKGPTQLPTLPGLAE
jgi:biopolymer transport protein ExbD